MKVCPETHDDCNRKYCNQTKVFCKCKLRADKLVRKYKWWDTVVKRIKSWM